MCGGKNKKNICVLAKNINSLGQFVRSLKEQNLKTFATEPEIDDFFLEEIGGRAQTLGLLYTLKEASHLYAVFNFQEKTVTENNQGGTMCFQLTK